MPQRITALTESQIIADIRTELRRRRNAGVATTSQIGEYQEFTVASGTLAYLPSSSFIPLVALNGLAGRYGTDYTVNFTTGAVSWSAGFTSGDVLSVWYQTNGDLIAGSTAADLGWTVLDTFDRADSTTTINPRSDGGTWTVTGGTFGISGNRGIVVATGGVCWADVGSNSTDVQVTNIRANTSAVSFLWFAVAATAGIPDGYGLKFTSDASVVRLVDYRTQTTQATVTGMSTWTGGSAVLRVTFNASTAAVTVYQNGTAVWSGTASGAGTSGSFAGFSSEAPSSTSSEFWDDFYAKPL